MASPPKSELGDSLDLVEVEKFEGSVVVMKNGSMKQIVMVGGVNFALKSELERNIITQGYQNFLNSVDFPLQIIIHSRKVNIGKYIAGLLARKESEASPLLRSQIDEYAEFVKGFVEKNAIMEKTFLVVVPFYPRAIAAGKKTASAFLPFFNKKGRGDKAAAAASAASDAATFKEDAAQLAQRTGQVMSGLAGVGLEVTVLEYDALIELFYNFYNPQTVEREDIIKPDDKAYHGRPGSTNQ